MASEVAGNHSPEVQYFRDEEQLVMNHLLFLVQMAVLAVLMSGDAIATVVAVAEQDRRHAVGNTPGNVAIAGLVA